MEREIGRTSEREGEKETYRNENRWRFERDSEKPMLLVGDEIGLERNDSGIEKHSQRLQCVR